MVTFCLEPSREIFDASARLASSSEFVEIWRAACGYKHDWRTDDRTDDHTGNFLSTEERLCKDVLARPTRSKAIQVLHIFYAMGTIRHIDLFYQLIGHEGLPAQTRAELARIYKETRDIYTDKLHTIEKLPPGIKLSDVNFSHFAMYDPALTKDTP